MVYRKNSDSALNKADYNRIKEIRVRSPDQLEWSTWNEKTSWDFTKFDKVKNLLKAKQNFKNLLVGFKKVEQNRKRMVKKSKKVIAKNYKKRMAKKTL